VYHVEDPSNRLKLRSDSREEISKDLPPEKGPRFRMTVYVELITNMIES
jgi:hypothetical protein